VRAVLIFFRAVPVAVQPQNREFCGSVRAVENFAVPCVRF